jgi:hypothetical protein
VFDVDIPTQGSTLDDLAPHRGKRPMIALRSLKSLAVSRSYFFYRTPLMGE